MVICFYADGNEWMNKTMEEMGFRTWASAQEREKKLEEGLKVEWCHTSLYYKGKLITITIHSVSVNVKKSHW